MAPPTPSSVNGRDKNEDDGLYTAAFKRLPERVPATVRLFDKSGEMESFVVYNEDAQLAAKHIFKTNAAIKRCKYKQEGDERTLEWAIINRNQFEIFIKNLLLVMQYRVEVYVNESSGKNRIDWVPKFKGSPGNLVQFEELLFTNSEMTVNNGVIGIKLGTADKTRMVGIAHANMNEGEIHLLEFADNDSFTNLESVLVQLSPKEAVIPSSTSPNEETNNLRRILERNKVLVNDQRNADFDTKDIEQDLAKILKQRKGKPQIVTALPEFERKFAMSAMAGVIKYLDLLTGESNQHQFSLKPFDTGLYVKMDAAASRALHLSVNILEKQSRTDISLLGVIDKCRTAQGHRLIAQYLKQPLMNKDKLEERLDLVQILVEDVLLRQSLHEEHLRRVPDCQVIAKKLMRKRAGLVDLYRAYFFLAKMNRMLEDLRVHESSRKHVLESYFIDPLTATYEELGKFQELVETYVDLEMAGKGEFMINADMDDDLKELKSDMDNIEEQMGQSLIKVARELGFEANKSIKLESNSQVGYFYRVTMKEEVNFRENEKYQIVHSRQGGVGFRDAKLDKLSNSYVTVLNKYEHEQKKVVSEVMGVASEYYTCFEQLGRMIAELDVFVSFAVVSANSPVPFVRPNLLPQGSGKMHLVNLRHPCIETLPNISYIPNDLDFEKGRQSFYIITGPNMGGKSTYLRSVGVAVLLAHVGCFVPASEAEISIVDAILARVGASDSLTSGVSTFMAEMIETSYILKTATSDSLVVIDELGRGTSTYDGFGLCWAISRHLAEKVDCFCLLATHFHELTALTDEIPTVSNYHVTAITQGDGLTMMYKIEKGPCDRSFGLHVAKYVGFPEDVLRDAEQMCRALEDFCQEADKDDSVAAVERRKGNKLEGMEVIKDFNGKLKQRCRELKSASDSGSMSKNIADGELQKYVEFLLEEVKKKAATNPYLQHLLNQSSNAFQPEQM